jgi:DUF438 domain-containing protein
MERRMLVSKVLNDNRKTRQEKLKEIVKDLHEGSDIKTVKRRFAELIRNVSPQEIADMEQALIAGGVPVEQVQKVCDVHVQVFEETLGRQKKTKTMPGHPVHTYREENKVVRQISRRLQKLMRGVPKGKEIEEFEKELEQLKKIEIHYQRKENQLFPYLESVDFTGPSKVMWGKHDEIRVQLRDFESAYRANDWKRFKAAGPAVFRAVRSMVFMEEKILFPVALKKLSDEQWAEIRKGEAEIGYAWIQPGNLWDPSVLVAGKQTDESGMQSTAGQEIKQADIALDVGNLSGEQINLLLKNLPVDISYVDEHDKVRYYSRGKERIFPRSPAVIGRAVQNCHPPKSVHIVEKILESFKKKEKDAAEFWLTLNERFIHIRYFPLYDEKGTYRGVLEVSQDVTEIRALKGEKRLLDM